jgi:hypothetical protein
MLARQTRWMCASVCAASVALGTAQARGEEPSSRPLSHTERQLLRAGQRVERPLAFRTRHGEYVGGVAYQVVSAEPALVLRLLEDVERLPELLPRTESARLLGKTARGKRIALTQGAGPFLASYGIELVRVEGADELRFWLDPTTPHDIRDVWGFFRAEQHPDGKALVTVAIAVDLGPGIVRSLFEERIQALLLRSVSRIRDAVEPRRMAGGSGDLR